MAETLKSRYVRTVYYAEPADDFCQFGALRFYRNGKEGGLYTEILKEELDFKKAYVNANECILCSLCIKSCPRDVIKVVRAVELKKLRRGGISICEGCIECGLCVENCPTKAIKIYRGKPVIDESKCILLRYVRRSARWMLLTFDVTHTEFSN